MTACSEDSKNTYAHTLLNMVHSHTLNGNEPCRRAAVRLHIMVAVVVIVDSLAAVKNAVCVCHCGLMFMCVNVWSTKEHADQHNSVSVPLLAPANTGDSVHN